MRVLIDPQIFLFQHRGGVSRLFSELANELSSSGVDVVLPFGYVRNEYVTRDNPDRMVMLKGNSRMLRPRALGLLNSITRLPPGGVDVVHHTWYWPEYLDRYRTKKRVSTVHDMIPELMPAESGGNPHTGKREYLEASDAIVCVSETTKADLLHHWGDFGKPVMVIHHGVGNVFFGPQAPSLDLPDRFVLFVGRRANYKNFTLLAEAFVEVASKDSDLHLVCVGGKPFDVAETDFFDGHGMGGRVHRFDVADADLPGVYAAAQCLVFPSKYEGFGLPVLESFASGCPVIISDTPALAEVAGGLATVVSPEDPTELAAAIATLTGQEGQPASSTLEAARQRAGEFTWARTSGETLGLYQQIVNA